MDRRSNLATIRAAIAASGLVCRGALNPTDPSHGQTIILVGFAGPVGWAAFAGSPEASDNQSDPLDRWSRRVVTALAAELGVTPLFPFDGPPFHPFQRWAQQAEPVYPSPLGILIHPDWGLWHSYRGALAFRQRLDLPPPDRQPSPCESCAAKPCLAACPANAFSAAGYDVSACISHLDLASSTGSDCLDEGCRARRACPVGAEHRYGTDQERFHMRGFKLATG